MFTTLHKEEKTIVNGWRVTRWRFFFSMDISIPLLLSPLAIDASYQLFQRDYWFAPKSVVVANLFGAAFGLDLFR